MLICPDGHPSTATDYCDVCGSPLTAAAPEPPVALCPACGQPSGGRFCEACGHDSAFAAPAAAPSDTATRPAALPADPPIAGGPIAWIATIDADRAYYDRVLARRGPDADSVEFPTFVPQRRIALHGARILIGKRSVSQGVHPDIDLGLAPADAGVSRAHALLHLTTTALTITDLGSTNGTTLNDSDDLIAADTPVQLRSGDRIHLGAWTTITLSTEPR